MSIVTPHRPSAVLRAPAKPGLAIALAVRACARRPVSVLALTAIALAPIAAIALATPAAADLAHAQSQRTTPWLVAALAWPLQMILVAGVAPAVREQARTFGPGLRAILRAIVPCAIAIAAIVVGVIALVVPGLVLLVLFAPTGASEQLRDHLPAPLADAVRAAHASLRTTIAVVVAALALDAAIPLIAQLALVHGLVKGASAAVLARPRLAIRVAAAALILVSPLVSACLAAVYRPAPPTSPQ